MNLLGRNNVGIASIKTNTIPKYKNMLNTRDFRNCIILSREILSQPGFKDFLEEEIQPGVNVESDEEIDEFIKNNAESAYHPCGTLKMGDINDPMAVVTSDCKVIGVDNL